MLLLLLSLLLLLLLLVFKFEFAPVVVALFLRECLPADEDEDREASKGLRSLSGLECTGALGVVSPPDVSRRDVQNEPSIAAT